MRHRRSIGGCALRLALGLAGGVFAIAIASAHDETKYPVKTGMYFRLGSGAFDPSKPGGRGQAPPLTPEFNAVWEAAMADEINGGQQYNPQIHCLPSGMPRMMIGYEPIEVIVTADTTYMRMLYMSEFRRIYTDGRSWPDKIEPAFAGYSIGRWVDQDGDGRYDVLEVETRGFKGPRVADVSGIPMHPDNQTVIKERIYGDKDNPAVFHDEITTLDHALTRPWSIKRSYKLEPKPQFFEYVCAEGNEHIFIGKENYLISGDGLLMPAKKDQAPPDLRYFNGSKN